MQRPKAGLIDMFFVVFLLLLHPAFSQEVSSVPPADHPTPTFTVTTRLVLLNVTATDKKGRPVTDLRKDELKVLEDGVEQELRVFQLMRPVVTVTAPQDLPAGVVTNASLVPPPTATRNIILVDTTIGWVEKNFAKSQVLKYLRRMPPDVPLAVFATTFQGIRMIQDFTTDRNLLEQSVRKNLKTWISPSRSIRPTGLRGLTYQEFAAVLASYPGRKNLIWMTDGHVGQPYQPRLTNATFAADLDPDWQRASQQMDRKIKALVDSQIAIYPMNPRGLEGPYLGTDRQGIPLFFRPITLYNTDAYGRMADAASASGGKAFVSRNDLWRGIDEGIRDGSNYYVVGYYPSNPRWDDRVHPWRRVQIEVNRREVRVRHRSGYLNRLPEAWAAKFPERIDDLQRALNLDAPLMNGVLFRASVLPSKQPGKVSVNFAVDAQTLDFQHGSDGRERAVVQCAAAAYDAMGHVVKAGFDINRGSLDPAMFGIVLTNGFPCSFEMELPKGSYQIKLAVRDNRNAAIGTVTASAAVPDR